MPRDSFWSKYNFAVLGLDCIALDNTRNYMYSIYSCTAHAHRLLQPMYLIHTCSRTKLQDTITSGIINYILFNSSIRSRHTYWVDILASTTSFKWCNSWFSQHAGYIKSMRQPLKSHHIYVYYIYFAHYIEQHLRKLECACVCQQSPSPDYYT